MKSTLINPEINKLLCINATILILKKMIIEIDFSICMIWNPNSIFRVCDILINILLQSDNFYCQKNSVEINIKILKPEFFFSKFHVKIEIEIIFYGKYF